MLEVKIFPTYARFVIIACIRNQRVHILFDELELLVINAAGTE